MGSAARTYVVAMRMLMIALLVIGCAQPQGTPFADASSPHAEPSTNERPQREQPPAPAASAKGDTNDAEIAEVMRSMEDQPAEIRQAFAGAAIAEHTKGRLVEPLRAAFDELQTVPHDMRRLALMKAFATPEVLAVWQRVCAAGPSAIAEMAKLRREEQGGHLARACQLTDSTPVTAEQAGKTDGIPLAAALVAAHQLDKTGIDRDLVQYFLKASPAH